MWPSRALAAHIGITLPGYNITIIAFKSRRMEKIQTSSSSVLPFPAEPSGAVRRFLDQVWIPKDITDQDVIKQSKVSFWRLYMPGLLLSLPASIWSQLQVPNCTLQAALPPDLHATRIKTSCLIPDFHNEPETFYSTLDFCLTWYEATQWHTHRYQSRGWKQQQLSSWHRAGPLWFLEQVGYLTSSR